MLHLFSEKELQRCGQVHQDCFPKSHLLLHIREMRSNFKTLQLKVQVQMYQRALVTAAPRKCAYEVLVCAVLANNIKHVPDSEEQLVSPPKIFYSAVPWGKKMPCTQPGIKDNLQLQRKF